MAGHGTSTVTPTDCGGVIVVTATLFLSWMVLVSLIRLYMRSTMTGPFGWDDLAALIACVLAVTNVGVTIDSVSHGLGQLPSSRSESQIEKAQKDLFAAEILFIAGHCAAKLSACLLLRRLGRERPYVRLCLGAFMLISAWGVASILAIGPKCDINRPWAVSPKCKNVDTRWKVITTFDVTTELLLQAIIVYLVWGVKICLKQKAAVIFAFNIRATVIALAILRQTYLNRAYNSPAIFLNISNAVATTEVLLNCSVMAPTVSCLKPFVIAFNTGWGRGTKRGEGSYYNQSGSGGSQSGPQGQQGTVADEEDVISAADSSNRSDSLIIQHTREWTVEIEPLKPQPVRIVT